MFGLLRFPDFPETLVTGFALTDLANLRVKVFEALALLVGRDFDRALFRNERDLIVSVFVRCAVEYRTNSFAHGHIVRSPSWIEQNTFAMLYLATGERD